MASNVAQGDKEEGLSPVTQSVLIGLGTNLGDRFANLSAALRGIADLPTTQIEAISPVYSTPPFGILDQPDFLNAVALLTTSLSPHELLHGLREVELVVGRVQREKWHEREIDIDILSFENYVVSELELTLPHPGISERSFVLIPLCDIAPDWVHPLSGLSATDMLAALGTDHSSVVRLDRTL